MLRKITTKIIFLLGSLTGKFITFHTRPIFTAKMSYRGKETAEDGLCAIVIQGPIRREDNFTLETVKLYRQHYPSATVILSTWEDEDVSSFETLKSERFEIILNSKPYPPGQNNINMQIASTKTGIDKAFSLGLKYILKTRTDTRMYGIDCLKFLINLLNRFPVVGSAIQRQRIIYHTKGSRKFNPYRFSDIFQFGAISDMKIFWKNYSLEKPATICPEIYLVSRFLENTEWEVKNTLENSFEALGKRFIVVDNESVDLYWCKYENAWREHPLINYFDPSLEITFKSWFNETYISV